MTTYPLFALSVGIIVGAIVLWIERGPWWRRIASGSVAGILFTFALFAIYCTIKRNLAP